MANLDDGRPVFAVTQIRLKHASHDNPRRVGWFVETIHIPRGQVNAGKHHRCTDGRGHFWLVPVKEAEMIHHGWVS